MNQAGTSIKDEAGIKELKQTPKRIAGWGEAPS
jgi:hypothetical protein